MSVDAAHSEHTPTALAGSEPINSAVTEESEAETALVGPGGAGRQESTSEASPATKRSRTPSDARSRLLWVCETCRKRINGSGSGFATVDLRDAAAASRWELGPDGTAKARWKLGPDGTAKARWRVCHAACAPEAVSALNPYFRAWCDRLQTSDDLLDALVELNRLPWFNSTDWAGMARQVLADTETAALPREQTDRAAKAAAKRRAQRGTLPPGDPRHGSDNGYVNYGCRCEPCTEAHTNARAARKQATAIGAS